MTGIAICESEVLASSVTQVYPNETRTNAGSSISASGVYTHAINLSTNATYSTRFYRHGSDDRAIARTVDETTSMDCSPSTQNIEWNQYSQYGALS